MSDTYSYEVLEPGGHARLVGNVLDRISEASANPASAVGSSRALLGDVETASWMERTTAADGAALIESVKGNTLRWNQLLRTDNGTSTIAQGVTRVINNGVVTLNGTSPAAESVKYVNLAGTTMTFTNGHKYLINIHNERLNYYANVTGGYSEYTYPRIFTAGADQLNGQLILTIPAAETVFENEVYTPQVFDLTAMFGAGNEPSTVAEFEALYPKPYYPYDPGSLLPVRMEGVETTGRNLFDVSAYPAWNSIYYGLDGDSLILKENDSTIWNNYGDRPYVVLSAGTYTIHTQVAVEVQVFNLDTVTQIVRAAQPTFTLTKQTKVGIKPITQAYPLTVGTVQLERGSAYTEYEPYWSYQRTIPAATYFPDGLRSAGSVYDELRADAAVTRVGAVDHTSDWEFARSTVNSHGIGYVQIHTSSSGSGSLIVGATKITSNINISTAAFADSTEREFAFNESILFYRFPATEPVTVDAAIADMEAHGAACFYVLATPTVTPIDPPLPLSYRVGAGGTERVMVASGTTSAPPIFVTRYPLDPADLAASIAPRESATAEANHAVGDLIMLGFTLCKVTTAIARGETITIGTNVTQTSVAAEIAALS